MQYKYLYSNYFSDIPNYIHLYPKFQEMSMENDSQKLEFIEAIIKRTEVANEINPHYSKSALPASGGLAEPCTGARLQTLNIQFGWGCFDTPANISDTNLFFP